MTPKEAFLVGVSSVLAEARVSPSELVTAVAKLAGDEDKESKGKKPEESTGIPLPGSGLAKTLGLGALGVTTLGSLAGGRALGHGAQHAMSSDLATTSDIRKQFLIKKLEDLVRARRARRQNFLVQEALQ
jgi:hypothetical protein